jgi:hypothetical protein
MLILLGSGPWPGQHTPFRLSPCDFCTEQPLPRVWQPKTGEHPLVSQPSNPALSSRFRPRSGEIRRESF